MDEKDRQLVGALRANGRLTYAELGRLVGLSGPSATDRVQRLEQAGVITGYHAAVSPEAIGRGVSALIGVYLTDSAEQDRVCTAMKALPEAEDCWFVAGEESFIVKVRTADVPALEGCISRLRRIDGVARTRTTVVLSTKWEGKVAPLRDEQEGDQPGGEPAGDEHAGDGPAGDGR